MEIERTGFECACHLGLTQQWWISSRDSERPIEKAEGRLVTPQTNSAVQNPQPCEPTEVSLVGDD